MASILFHVLHKRFSKTYNSQTKPSTLSAWDSVEQPGPLFAGGRIARRDIPLCNTVYSSLIEFSLCNVSALLLDIYDGSWTLTDRQEIQ